MTTCTPDPIIEQFWDNECFPVISPLLKGKYRLPKVQQRYNFCLERIVSSFGASLNFSLSPEMAPDVAYNGLLPLGCSVVNGHPNIAVFVPALMILSEMIEREHETFSAQGIFENTLVVGLMHEMDHLQLGLCYPPTDTDEIINSERLVWAETCENTIRLFLEVYQEDLGGSDTMFYDHWIAARRNKDSFEWRYFIADIYSRITRNGKPAFPNG